MDETQTGGISEYQDRDPLRPVAPPATTDPAQPPAAGQVHQLGVMDIGLPRRGSVPGDPLATAPSATAAQEPVAQQVDAPAEPRERFIPRERLDEVINDRNSIQERLAALEAERAQWEAQRQQAPALPEDIVGYMPFIERLRMQGSPEQIEAMLREQEEQAQQEQARQQNQAILGEMARLVDEGHLTQEGLDAIAPALRPLLDQLAEVAPLVAERQRTRAEQAADAHVQRMVGFYPHADPVLLKRLLARGASPQEVLADARDSHAANLARYGNSTPNAQQQPTAPVTPPPPAPPVIPMGGAMPVAPVNDGPQLGIPDSRLDPKGYASYWYELTGDPMWLQLGSRT